MKIYVLKLYTDERKFNPCDIGGYFTSKAALIRAIKKYANEIGEIYGGTIEEYAKNDFLHFDSELANIEVEETNKWIA